MQTAQNKLSEQEIAQVWAKITIIKWKKKLVINKVGNSGALLQSFQYNVLATVKKPERIKTGEKWNCFSNVTVTPKEKALYYQRIQGF